MFENLKNQAHVQKEISFHFSPIKIDFFRWLWKCIAIGIPTGLLIGTLAFANEATHEKH
jgi:hypothetical protein